MLIMRQKNYVAYLRQSTVKQEVSGLGVEAQREIIQNYLKDRKTIAEYIETESGRNPIDQNLQKLWSYAGKQILS